MYDSKVGFRFIVFRMLFWLFLVAFHYRLFHWCYVFTDDFREIRSQSESLSNECSVILSLQLRYEDVVVVVQLSEVSCDL